MCPCTTFTLLHRSEVWPAIQNDIVIAKEIPSLEIILTLIKEALDSKWYCQSNHSSVLLYLSQEMELFNPNMEKRLQEV